ncbi:lytic transglycosylase domain-containing protein [Xanthomonas euvesicatoria]|uniref:lytic transglycosylase domain-containing protein n=1 Tax=Xanthomonas euvesicatoria TaxID=456327 RepID=UPI001C471EC8|nr:lytic transglycosylase domain-containing protein [Xanthomonas euvesicatoria]
MASLCDVSAVKVQHMTCRASAAALSFCLVLVAAAGLPASAAAAPQQAAPENLQMRAACVSAAAQRYGVPPSLVWAVIKTEGGTTGRTSTNKNGSKDMGLMQINTIHLHNAPHNLVSRGITRDVLINDECVNIAVGTYILSYELNNKGYDFWTNVGAYNSRTPVHNEHYRAKVWNNLLQVLQGR